MAAASSKKTGYPPSLFKVEKGALCFDLKLTPKAKQNAITGVARDADGSAYLKASVTAVPEKGKANTALIKLLAGEWKIAKSQITISRGQTNTRKTIEIAGEIDKVRASIKACPDI
ncbi:MAG: DUF167 domain-containing protein [Rhodospirillaceae bacterium]|jgi:uncharacterized protein|nr:DUF167 domain-containing protein [Rhodospirillaceae bacterium]MBT4588235.1 DUF167 domain-containing protein [Rhodospirillaceae bacterium]MBT7266576.1 DUF167 domain-containing protein [Rhodospirillaceae bacterium]